MRTLLEPTSGFASSTINYLDDAYFRWERQQQKLERAREEIREWCRANPKPVKQRPFHKPWTEGEFAKVKQMRAKGETIETIATVLDRSYGSVFSRLHREEKK